MKIRLGTVPGMGSQGSGGGSFDWPTSSTGACLAQLVIFAPSSFDGDAAIYLGLTSGPSAQYTWNFTSQNAPQTTSGGAKTMYNIFTNGTFFDSTFTFDPAAAAP